MQRRMLAIAALLTLAVACPPAQGAESAAKTGVTSKKVSPRKMAKKKKLTPQQARALQKKAEAEGRRHQQEAQQQNYQLMLEAQRRGMQQQPQMLPPPQKPH